jgi:LmbE family N-acetylglucosaminyl deacetylase
MKSINKFFYLTVIGILLTSICFAQPDEPIEQWKGKTILLIGAHPDDDHQSHGTLAMLIANGNIVYIVTLTTGNVGTKDPRLSQSDLAKIRRQEQVDAMKEIGLSENHYVNLGYDDGRVEFANKEEVVGKLVHYIRKFKPDVLFSFDPGFNYQVWHKSDHRAAAYLAADAVRASEWPLMYEGDIIQDKLEAHLISEFLFYGGNVDDKNTIVNIDEYVDKRVEAGTKYVSQWTSGWSNYLGPDINNYPAEEKEKLYKKVRNRVKVIDGKSVERFRYHKGIPDTMGHSPRD